MISISGVSDGIVVAIHGDIHPKLLDQVLADVSDDEANSQVVIDLRDAVTIDPDGLAVIAGASERVRRRRGNLVLYSPHGAVRRELQRQGLHTAAS